MEANAVHPSNVSFSDHGRGRAQFTPGPWLMELDNFGDYTIVQQGDTLAIAAVVNGEMRRMGGHSEEHEANALLIASAPDLAAVVKAFVAHYPVGTNPFLDAAYREGRAAIARAGASS